MYRLPLTLQRARHTSRKPPTTEHSGSGQGPGCRPETAVCRGVSAYIRPPVLSPSPARSYPVEHFEGLLLLGGMTNLPPYSTAFDRGPAKYFHGRTDVLDFFAHLRERAKAMEGGTTMLIQGAPGAGKSALLHQCGLAAEDDGWKVAEIEMESLYNPATMGGDLGKSYTASVEHGANINLKFFSYDNTREHRRSGAVSAFLRDKAPESGLLLILDEVQTIRALAGGADAISVTATLNAIHNGKLGRPVILLAGGLGSSRDAFSSLGISRFAGGCVVNLGRLDRASERSVIRDWLVIDGEAKGDVTPWIDAIAAETHGWPQHIMTYAQPAAWRLREDGGELTHGGLMHTLEQGMAGKAAYYEGRASGVGQGVVALGGLLRNLPPGVELWKVDIIEALKAHPGVDDARTEFATLLDKGVIAELHPARYAVPIPSMQTWLVEQGGPGLPPLQLPRQESPILER